MLTWRGPSRGPTETVHEKSACNPPLTPQKQDCVDLGDDTAYGVTSARPPSPRRGPLWSTHTDLVLGGRGGGPLINPQRSPPVSPLVRSDTAKVPPWRLNNVLFIRRRTKWCPQVQSLHPPPLPHTATNTQNHFRLNPSVGLHVMQALKKERLCRRMCGCVWQGGTRERAVMFCFSVLSGASHFRHSLFLKSQHDHIK